MVHAQVGVRGSTRKEGPCLRREEVDGHVAGGRKLYRILFDGVASNYTRTVREFKKE